MAVRLSSSSESSTAGRKVEVEVEVEGLAVTLALADAVVAGGGVNEGLSASVDSDEPWRTIREACGGKNDLGFEPDEVISSCIKYNE